MADEDPNTDGDSGRIINLKFMGEDNTEVHFVSKITTMIKKLKQAYSDRQGVPYESIVCCFDGKRTDDDATLKQLGLSEGSVIEVYYKE